jgi:hypothetical protein
MMLILLMDGGIICHIEQCCCLHGSEQMRGTCRMRRRFRKSVRLAMEVLGKVYETYAYCI